MTRRPSSTWLWVILVLGISSVVIYSFTHRAVPKLATETIRVNELSLNGTTVSVELVRTKAEQEKGLSGRNSLAPNHGMLFVFDHPDFYGFWMPDMQFSIDMIWIDQDGRIVDIASRVPPESYPHVFKPKAPALYVLEVVAGLAEKSGWHEGDQFTISHD